MADYVYEALGVGGKRDSGTLTANSEREAITVLDARGLYPLRIEPLKSVSVAKGGKRLKGKLLAQFFGQLADLLRAGVPLLRSLETLGKGSSQPVLKDILREVHADVSEGTSLADALGQHPRAFNELIVSMVRAGQEGGFLEDVLERIAQFTENQDDLRSKVVGAMAYPIFLAIAMFIVLNCLVIFIVPLFEPIFKALKDKGELPFLTSALMATSHLFLDNWEGALGLVLFLGLLPFLLPSDFQSLSPSALHREASAVFRAILFLCIMIVPPIMFLRGKFVPAILLAAVMGGLYLLRAWAASPGGRLTIDRWRLNVPSAGTIYQNLALSRFTRILGTMLHNGIPILQSLRVAKDSTGNLVLTQAIDRAADNLAKGEKLAAPLSVCRYFPRDVIEMISIGEESNQLEKVLLDIANALEKRTARQLELFVRLLEPVMLLVMAGIALLVVSGLMLPIFKMSSAVR